MVEGINAVKMAKDLSLRQVSKSDLEQPNNTHRFIEK